MKTGSYIIAETAYNHEGQIDYLYRMVNDISDLKLDAVKFHLLLNPQSYMQKDHPLVDSLKKWIFTEKQWIAVLKYSKQKKLDVVALCDDWESLKLINEKKLDIDAVELNVSSINDFHLLSEAAKFKKMVILGVGGSTLEEVRFAVDFLKHKGKRDILLMHGFQSFPTDYSLINLSRMLKLRDLFDLSVGYADHTAYNDKNNEVISCLAAALGVRILEKHYTPEFAKKRIDYHSAVGKKQMARIKKLMDLFLMVYGNGQLEMSTAELEYGKVGPMKKAIVAKKSIKKGEELSTSNMCFKRTQENSISGQLDFYRFLGFRAAEDIKEDEVIDFSKISFKSKNKSYSELTGGIGKKK